MSILLVAYYKMGIIGVYIAQLTASGFSFLITLFLMRDWLSPRYFQYARLKEMLVFSLPLVPASVAYWLLNSAGSYFMEYYANKTEIGLYQIGSSLGGGINLVITAFLQAWVPFAMSVSKNEDAKSIYADSLLLYLIVIGFFQVLLSIFSNEILLFVTTPEYLPARNVVGLLGLNALILGISQVVSIGSNLAKSNLPYGKAVLVGSAITVILYYLFVPSFGKEGSALSTIAGNAITACLVYYFSQKLYFIPYNIKFSIFLLLSIVLVSVLGNMIQFEGVLTTIFFKSLLILIYVLTLFLFNRNNIILLKKI
jgi:O-antigen/teichoic acid export membrane protein